MEVKIGALVGGMHITLPLDPTIFFSPSILKFFLRSAQNHHFWRDFWIFWPTEKQKTLGPKSSAIWDLWRDLPFKIDLHPPGTLKPSKNTFLLQQKWFFEDFGVPGGCKSILNCKSLHKSYIAELFGPRVFCFSVGPKSRQKWWFWADLKKNFNIFLKALSRHTIRLHTLIMIYDVHNHNVFFSRVHVSQREASKWRQSYWTDKNSQCRSFPKNI